jgi:hypothetical protein
MTLTLFKRLRARFVERPLPDAVFALAPGHLSGLRVLARGRAARERFILPFKTSLLVPSFDRPNITDVPAVKAAIAAGQRALGFAGGPIALLIPEPCVRIFVLAADALPGDEGERDAFVRWRVGKQMPLLPEDLRMAYAMSSGSPARKIIVATARKAVVREYEDIFQSAGMAVGTVTVPSLSLVNLIGGAAGQNGVLLNIEADYLSFLAIMESEWTLYRHKGVSPNLSAGAKADLVVQEVENTVHFLEDKERKKVERIWVRSGAGEDGPGILSRLKSCLPLPAAMVDYAAPDEWDAREITALAPLMGQLS